VAGCCLDQEQMLTSGFDFSFPAVDGFDRRELDIDAGGEVCFGGVVGRFCGLRGEWGRLRGPGGIGLLAACGIHFSGRVEGEEKQDLPQR